MAKLRIVLGLVALAILVGCRNDMHDQPRFKPLAKSDFYADLRSSRVPVEGTVARGDLREDSYFYTGKIGANPGDYMPAEVPVNEENLQRGRERFNIYCAPCHSRVGDGNGMIVKRGYRQAANFHQPRYLAQPVGHYFDVMSHGWGAMPDYAAQIEPADRWAIAAYIRALQYSQSGTMGDVPADQRGNLQDQSQITVEGIPLTQALASGGKGSSEEISPAGANPIPAMNKEIGGASRPEQQAPPKEEGTKKK